MYLEGASEDVTEKEDWDLVTKTIVDHWWWVYMELVLIVHETCEELSTWSERCPCHESSSMERALRRMLLKSMRKADDMDTCCLKGRRAPELAAGHLSKFLDQLWPMQWLRLADGFLHLSEQQQQQLIGDFEAAKMQITLVLQQKLACWSLLPWRLCALGHQDPAVRKEAAQECLQLFDRVAAEPALHHPLSWKLLRAGGDFREAVSRMALTGEFEDESLEMEVAALSLIPLQERVAERTHSDLNRWIAKRRNSGPYVSFGLRVSEIEAVSKRGGEHYERLCHAVEISRTPLHICNKFGCRGHPEVQGVLLQRGAKGLGAVVGKILYSLDLETQYGNTDAKHKQAHAARVQRSSLARRLIRGHHDADTVAPVPVETSLELLLRRASIDHFRWFAEPGTYMVFEAAVRVQLPEEAPVLNRALLACACASLQDCFELRRYIGVPAVGVISISPLFQPTCSACSFSERFSCVSAKPDIACAQAVKAEGCVPVKLPGGPLVHGVHEEAQPVFEDDSNTFVLALESYSKPDILHRAHTSSEQKQEDLDACDT